MNLQSYYLSTITKLLINIKIFNRELINNHIANYLELRLINIVVSANPLSRQEAN